MHCLSLSPSKKLLPSFPCGHRPERLKSALSGELVARTEDNCSAPLILAAPCVLIGGVTGP